MPLSLKNKSIDDLTDLICLLYHEARNVRHPLKEGKLSKKSRYEKLLNLPTNRNLAWKQLSKTRDKFAKLSTSIDIKDAFNHEFHISLEDLLQLYKEPCWKDSSYGGNKWFPICKEVISLVDKFDSIDEKERLFYINSIKTMEHNTGTIEEKLNRLESE